MGFRALLIGRMNMTTQELIVPAEKKKTQRRNKKLIQVKFDDLNHYTLNGGCSLTLPGHYGRTQLLQCTTPFLKTLGCCVHSK